VNGQSTTGPSILVTAKGFQSRISDVYFQYGGAIDVHEATGVMLTNIYLLQPTCAADTYAIDLHDYNTLDHAVVNGNVLSVCHGIRANFGHISNAQVYKLNDGDGITTTLYGSQVLGCAAYSLGDGRPYVLAAGTIAADNFEWADGLAVR
jgi:hypothetical protein